MRRTLLISVAAIALAAGTNLADAQRGPMTQGAPQAAPQAAPAENPAATSPSTADPGSPTAREHVIPEKQDTAQPNKGTGAPPSTDAQLHRQPTPQSVGNADENGPNRDGKSDRAMTTRNVSLSNDQKSTIREKVLTSSAPRVSGRVNFDIKVGVVVPRTIRVAPLPDTIVEIEPSWRGYMYFVSGDEIIVVEPNSLRIVAVLEV